MARGGSSLGANPPEPGREGMLAQPANVKATVSAAANETSQRVRGVIIVSSESGSGALGALSLSAQNAVQPTHGWWCPTAQIVFCPQPRVVMHITPLPAKLASASTVPVATDGQATHAITDLLRAWG